MDRLFPASRATLFIVASVFVTMLAQGGPVTPVFVCGQDETLPAPIPLRSENVLLAADGRLYQPCAAQSHDGHRESREAILLLQAATDPRPDFRRLAAQARGRLGRPAAIMYLTRPISADRPAALDDTDAGVRRAAASGIGDLLSGAQVEPFEGPADVPTVDQLASGRLALEARLNIETDDVVAGTILETLGRIKYKDDETRAGVEIVLVGHAGGKPPRLLGAAKGLEALIRGNARRPIGDATRQKLRAWAVIGPALTAVPTIAGNGTAMVDGDDLRLARIRRLALLSLQAARDDDLDTLAKAAHDADWQVRRLVALRIDLSRPDFAPIYQLLSSDPAFQVRYEVAGAVSRLARQTHDCGALLKMTSDPSVLVAVRATDELPDACADPAPIVTRLTTLSGALRDAAAGGSWHLAAHAFTSLARISRDAATPLLDLAAAHGTWQVRAAAAKAAGTLHNETVLVTLAGDREPNVRTAALESLSAMKSPAVTAAAVRALDSDDYQFLMTAANVLKGTPEPDRSRVSSALLSALSRLTRAATDTSRDPRKAILSRLGEVLARENAGLLMPYGADFDPRIRDAAAQAWAALTGTAMPPAATPQHRYPLVPTLDQIQNLPASALIKMTGGGTIEILLNVREAPMTVARFATLVRTGYYNGLTFHRVVPNFVIQGGSPGASEYMGAPRYWRDEVGLEPNLRGSVGLSTRGHDAGDGQIFIDLTDQPRLDHDYTIFARVVSGLDVVDGVLEGARIASITLK